MSLAMWSSITYPERETSRNLHESGPIWQMSGNATNQAQRPVTQMNRASKS